MPFLRTLAYYFEEGVQGLWRHKALHAFALLVVAVSLYVLGFSRYVTANIHTLLQSWQGGLEVRLFLEDGISPERVRALGGKFGGHRSVASVRFVSPEEALQLLTRMAPAFAGTAGDLPRNPLPPSLALHLKAPVDLAQVRDLLRKAEKEPGVSQVLFDWTWVERLRTYTRFVGLTGWVLFGVLAASALLTVAAITKILALSRKEEIAVLHFMGATNTTVRGPFIAGGAVLGVLAGALALALLAATHGVLRHAPAGTSPILEWITRQPLLLGEQALLVLSGGILGGVGGGVSLGSSEHWG